MSERFCLLTDAWLAELPRDGTPAVALLVPVSRREAFAPIRRPPAAWLRNRGRRALDAARARLGLAVAWHHSAYEGHAHTNRGDIAIASASRALLEGALPGARIVEIGWAEFPAAFEWVAAHARLFVLGGGGYFYAHARGRLAGRVARDAALLARLGCPAASLAPGVNRLLEDAAAPWDADSAATLGALLDRLSLSSARDAASVAWLDQARPGRTRLLADPALFLEPAAPPRPRGGGAPIIGLNLAFHGPASSRALPARLRLLIGAATRLRRRTGCAFQYFVHSEAERAIPPLLRAAGLPVETIDAPAEAMLPRYAALDLHICQMLHSSILAANAGTPFVALGYDIKNAAFAELMGVSACCLPADATTPTQLDAAIAAALDGRAALAATLAARKRALRAGMDAYLAELARHAG